MTIYTVTLDDGSKFEMSANLTEASAPISANFHGDEEDWQNTPFQTADARHDADNAAELVNNYFCAHDDYSQVVSVIGGDR